MTQSGGPTSSEAPLPPVYSVPVVPRRCSWNHLGIGIGIGVLILVLIMVLVLTPLPPAVSPVYSGPLAMLLAPSTTPTTLPFSIPIPILKTVVRPLFYMQWVQCTVAPVCCTLYQFQYQYHCQYPYQFQYQYHCPSLLPQVGWFSAVAPQQCSFIFHLGIGFSICNGISIGIDNGVIVSNGIDDSIGIFILV